MSQLIDMTGQRFGLLTVITRVGTSAGRSATWECICDCGERKIIAGLSLRRGATKSCGCYKRRVPGIHKPHLIHGMRQTPTYKSWAGMIQRCNNLNDHKYPDYGGRGIKVCERWQQDFRNFLSDMGERPSGMSLDRINNDGDYEPGNCQWATPTQQANNRRERKDSVKRR